MSVRNGFSTLNRFLGKKNKDKNISKSSTNLSLSSNHLDTTLSSHLQTQNRITPLPVATSNAPFEQTFRITVLLPRDQLYVARLGAKIKLEKLLELVCENKQLDSEIYEFRHSTDSSQVFNLDLTIGSVGLTEIRLCHKSETYDNFNSDEIIKLRHQTVGRDSLSSSEFSSRNSKHTKTASPYSSTNSLNSIDSTGMNTNYRAPLSLPPPSSTIQKHESIKNIITTTTATTTTKLPPVAPARKKRMAPRPPNQNNNNQLIENKLTNGIHQDEHEKIEQQNQQENILKTPLPRKEFHVSTPNLSTFKGLTILESPEFHQSNLSIDCNGNTNKITDNNNIINNNNGQVNGQLNGKENIENENHHNYKSFTKLNMKKRPMSMHIINHDINIATTPAEECENRLNGHLNTNYGSVQSLNTDHINNGLNESQLRLPEPSPRKRIIIPKKKMIAPAPPPRTSIITTPPIATPRITTGSINNLNESHQQEKIEIEDLSTPTSQQNNLQINNNVSKVMLNQSELDSSELSVITQKSPQSEFKDLPISPTSINNNDEFFTPTDEQNDFTNYEDTQTDSGIGEPIPSPTPDSLPPSEASHCDESLKSNFETSSDDDEHIKVYNLKLGKTIKQPVVIEEHKTLENLTEINNENNNNNNNNKISSKILTNNTSDINSLRSNSPNWTYTIPAPANFADIDEPTSSVKSESSSTESACGDMIKTNDIDKIFIKERSPPVNNFQICKADVHYSETEIKDDPIIINECEIFKKCKKPVRNNDDEILKQDEKEQKQQTSSTTTTMNDTSIINSDIEDGYYGNKKNINNDNIKFEEYLNKENLRKDINKSLNNINDGQQQQEIIIKDLNRCISPSNSIDINVTKTDVLNQLNNVISENGGVDKIINKKLNENENIESAAGPCNLSNFKISTYIPPNSPVKTFTESNDTNNNNNIQNNDEIIIKETEIIKEDDEKLYRKRKSLTGITNLPIQFLKSRRSITRSDSFHSTIIKQNLDKSLLSSSSSLSESFNNLHQNSRSSSFLSLLATHKHENFIQTQQQTNLLTINKFSDTNRNKSSSELSIGESPSLQSLIIMKSILNGHKNNLNNDTETDKVISIYGNQNKSESINIINNNTNNNNNNIEDFNNEISPKNNNNNNNNNNKILSDDIFKVEHIPIINNNNLNDNNIIENDGNNNNNNMNNNNDDGSEKSDDQPEKIWKYQGPPSINLSTWNERPKIQQVTIKNEGDYKFGGGNNNNNTNSIKTITATTSISPLPRNYRNSLPATTFSIQQQPPNTTNSTQQQIILKPSQPKIPFVRSVEYKKMNSSIMINNNNNNNNEKLNNSEELLPKSFSAGTNTMTLGRIPKTNRQLLCTQVPIVKGFQSLNIDIKDTTTNEQFKIQSQQQPPSNKINSINNLDNKNYNNHINNRYSYAGNTNINQNIDDQIILNRKIEKENTIPAFAQITLRKTGLKDKIYATSNNNNNNNENKLVTVKRLDQLEQENCKKIEIKLIEQNINNNNIESSLPSLPQQPPPPPPIIRSVVTKQNSNPLSITTTNSSIIDPHDQLLAAIRDFNKNELKPF